jgi:hypothetical protein
VRLLTPLVRRPLLAGAVVLAVTVAVLGALTPGYSHGADTVSRLASPGQPHAAVARAALVGYGLLVVAGAGALGRHAPGRERLLVALTCAYGGAGVVAGLAAKDLPGTAPTAAGAVHVAAALAGGGAAVASMALVWRRSPDPRRRLVAGALAVAVPTLALAFQRSWGTGVYGYVERLLVALPVLWLAALERDPDPVRRDSAARRNSAVPAAVALRLPPASLVQGQGRGAPQALLEP